MADISKLKLFGIEIEVDISDAQIAGGKNGDVWHVALASGDDYLVELHGTYEMLTGKLREALGMLEDVKGFVADGEQKR